MPLNPTEEQVRSLLEEKRQLSDQLRHVHGRCSELVERERRLYAECEQHKRKKDHHLADHNTVVAEYEKLERERREIERLRSVLDAAMEADVALRLAWVSLIGLCSLTTKEVAERTHESLRKFQKILRGAGLKLAGDEFGGGGEYLNLTAQETLEGGAKDAPSGDTGGASLSSVGSSSRPASPDTLREAVGWTVSWLDVQVEASGRCDTDPVMISRGILRNLADRLRSALASAPEAGSKCHLSKDGELLQAAQGIIEWFEGHWQVPLDEAMAPLKAALAAEPERRCETSDGFQWTGQGCDVCGFGTVEDCNKFDPAKPCPECGVTMKHPKPAEPKPTRATYTTHPLKSAKVLLGVLWEAIDLGGYSASRIVEEMRERGIDCKISDLHPPLQAVANAITEAATKAEPELAPAEPTPESGQESGRSGLMRDCRACGSEHTPRDFFPCNQCENGGGTYPNWYPKPDAPKPVEPKPQPASEVCVGSGDNDA